MTIEDEVRNIREQLTNLKCNILNYIDAPKHEMNEMLALEKYLEARIINLTTKLKENQ